MRAERMPKCMHAGFSHTCFRIVLFDQFPDTASIERRAVSGEKERLVINNVVLLVTICQIPLQRPFQLRHEGNLALFLPLPLSDDQLVMEKINIPYLQGRQFTLPNPRLEKRQQDGIVPTVSLGFKQQCLVLMLEEHRGVFLLFPRPYNGFSGIPGDDVVLFEKLEEMVE